MPGVVAERGVVALESGVRFLGVLGVAWGRGVAGARWPPGLAGVLARFGSEVRLLRRSLKAASLEAVAAPTWLLPWEGSGLLGGWGAVGEEGRLGGGTSGRLNTSSSAVEGVGERRGARGLEDSLLTREASRWYTRNMSASLLKVTDLAGWRCSLLPSMVVVEASRRGKGVAGRVEGEGAGWLKGKGDLLLADGGSERWIGEKRRGERGEKGRNMGLDEVEEPQGDRSWNLEAW